MTTSWYSKRAMAQSTLRDHEIHRQWTDGKSIRKLARELGLSTNRVSQLLHRHRARFGLIEDQPCNVDHSATDAERHAVEGHEE